MTVNCQICASLRLNGFMALIRGCLETMADILQTEFWSALYWKIFCILNRISLKCTTMHSIESILAFLRAMTSTCLIHIKALPMFVELIDLSGKIIRLIAEAIHSRRFLWSKTLFWFYSSLLMVNQYLQFKAVWRWIMNKPYDAFLAP